uniref:Apoptotic chromatin condensation inducer 1a n=2 Tax=Cynoglossus semilaevis TaxID=244447 RepID=A0A3P8X1S2_CYNSE
MEQERIEMERTLEKERVERERALEDERGKAIEQERLEREEAVRNEKKERERELSSLAEKGRQSDSVSSKSGQEVGLTTLSTPTTPTSEPDRKPLSEDVQEVVPAPLFHGAPPSQTLLSPQSPFKKSRFFRDSPIQPPPSSTSVVIMRPTPRPESSSVLSPTSVGEQQHEAQHRSAKHEDPQMQTKMDAAGSIGIQSQQTGLGKTEHHAVATTEKVQEVDERQNQSAQRREGRSVEKEEKPTRQRSSSNESSSSESESGSSSSGSSRSSDSSSEEKPFISRSRREANSRTDSSPEPMVTDEVSNDIPKASPRKRDRSRDDDNTTVDGERPTKKPFTEAPSQDEKQRQRTYSGQEEETDKPRPVKETAMAEPEKTPENNEETPKTFSARKISLSNNKLSPGGSGVEGEQESGAAAGRKRRWGSSTAVTAKKPSISITTDSLKSLIPDIRPCLGQEAVVDLHPEEAVLSGIEDEERERSDQDLQIRRTVTQVVHPESQENGQKETKRSRLEELEEEDQAAEVEITRAHEEKMETSFTEAGETQSPSRTSHDAGNSTVTPSDTLIRRSISQQKTGVSITIDDPVRTTRQPSPPRGKVSNIVHVCNLVRPFTLGQLKELLSRTGTLVDDGFWIDKIKSHCYVTYSSSEEAVATRAALHGVKWPQSNPKLLSVDFCLQEELDFHKTMGERPDKPGAEEQGPGRGRTAALPPLLPERDQWAEREREMERREKGRAEREWDRDKVREFEKLGAEKEGASRRSRSRERRRKERGKSKEKKSEKKEKPEDPPAKLLDDLFRKTKAAPCIYWLPLTDEQYVQRQADRVERQKEREKRRKELEEEEEKKREEERKERMKTAGGAAGDRSEGEKDKDRERERDKDRGRDRERERERENDKRRDGYRRPGGSTTGGSRRSRSRSRSDPRDRRR